MEQVKVTMVETYRWSWGKSIGLGFLLANGLVLLLDVLVALSSYGTVMGSGLGLLILILWVCCSIWLHRGRTRPVASTG